MSTIEYDNISTIIFDLDGTLYQDTHHFSYYSDKIKEKLPHHLQHQYQEEYNDVVAGKHLLKIGRVYDLKEDNILVVVKGQVEAGYNWNGCNIDQYTIDKLYPQEINIDMERYFSVGDMWWVPATVGRHFGLTAQHTKQAFLETREFMKGPNFKMEPVEGLKDCLSNLKALGVDLILLTNSPQPDSEAIITKLGLSEVFSKKIFSAKKPGRTVEHFANIAQDFQSDYSQMMSIGDNWLNDILPANELGMSTIFIDGHEIGDKDSASVVVKTVGEIVPYLYEFM